MRTSLEATDILYRRANEALFLSAINLTGDIYKKARPAESDKEDVVINSLGLVNNDIQRGILNINIHVPNLELEMKPGEWDRTLPDLVRLQQLTAMFCSQFNEVYSEDVWFYVQQDTLIEDTNGSFYSNIRVEFNAVNTEGHIGSVFNPTQPGGETDPVYVSERGDLVRSSNNQW